LFWRGEPPNQIFENHNKISMLPGLIDDFITKTEAKALA
jgi:hypothetical protein